MDTKLYKMHGNFFAVVRIKTTGFRLKVKCLSLRLQKPEYLQKFEKSHFIPTQQQKHHIIKEKLTLIIGVRKHICIFV